MLWKEMSYNRILEPYAEEDSDLIDIDMNYEESEDEEWD